MVTIRLTNSKSHRKEVFEPLDPTNVRMYVCGPTVYDRAHLGNARPVVVFDTLYRLLRHVYGAEHVTYVRNFTDVDDKINAKAAQTGRAIRDITDETIQWYHDDMDALGAMRPNHEPRATEFIGAMIAMIQGLVAKGHAYVAEGHVLFRVRSYADYGALSGRSVDDMIAGARVEVAPFKEDPMDFVLWKPSGEGVPGWDSPWGYGRPGWHIECSAMADRLLWEDLKSKLSPEALAHPHTFDIHGGGLDLQFPHHENEIAQSCCAHGNADQKEDGFARVWLHNEMLLVEGKKMSKSLGNFFTVRDLLQGKTLDDVKYPGEVIRFVLLSTHYRSPMDWTVEKAEQAKATLRTWRRVCGGADIGSPNPEVLDCLCDDIDTPGAMAHLHRLAKEGKASELLASAGLMGLLTEDLGEWARSEALFGESLTKIREILVKRQDARAQKDFVLADKIRKALAEFGIEIEDMPDGKVKPKTDVLRANAYFAALSDAERKKVMGDSYDPETGRVDATALANAYDLHVARLVLEALK